MNGSSETGFVYLVMVRFFGVDQEMVAGAFKTVAGAEKYMGDINPTHVRRISKVELGD